MMSNELNESTNIIENLPSTQSLLNSDLLTTSTTSLINQDIGSLLQQVHLSGESFGSGSDSDDVLSNEHIETLIREEFDDHEGFPETHFVENSMVELRDGSRSPAAPYNFIFRNLHENIKLFLQRNKLSMRFLEIFKTYVDYLIFEGMDPTKDEYVLSVKNELLPVLKVDERSNEILSIFLLNPANLGMQFALYNSKKNLESLNKFFKTFQLKFQIKKSLIELESVMQKYFKGKYFQNWREKNDKVSTSFQQTALQFDISRILSMYFYKLTDKRKMISFELELADNYLSNKFFNKWISIYNLTKDQDNLAGIHLKKKMFRRLKRKKLLNDAYLNNVTIQKTVEQKFFGIWKKKLKTHILYVEKADFSRKMIVLEAIFSRWYMAFLKLNEQDQDFCRKVKVLELRKALDFIMYRYLKHKQNRAAETSHQNIVKRHYFSNIWKKRFTEHKLLFDHKVDVSDSKKIHFFKIWRKKLQQQLKGIKHRDTQLKRKYISKWKKKSILLARCSELDSRCSEVYFNMMIKKYKYIQKANTSYECFLKRRSFCLWNDKHSKLMEMNHLQTIKYVEKTLKNVYSSWRRQLLVLNEMEKSCRVFQKVVAFYKIQKACAKMDRNHHFLCKFEWEMRQNKLYKVFHDWLIKVESRKEKKLNVIFELNVDAQNTNLQKVFLLKWYSKTNEYTHQYAEKAAIFRNFSLEQNIMQRLLFKRRNLDQMHGLSTELYNGTLLHKTFVTWVYYKKKLNDYNQLHLDNMIKISRLSLRKILNQWTVRRLKLEHNEGMVNSFQKRWNRAMLRGLLRLWRTRTKNSPKKLRNKRQIDFNSGKDLVTPVRGLTRNNDVLFTGSEELKTAKIEALMSRYGRAKKFVPSPIKNTDTLNSTMKRNIDKGRYEQDNTTQKTSSSLPSSLVPLGKNNKSSATRITDLKFDKISTVRLDPVIDQSSFDSSDISMEFDDSPIKKQSRG